MIFDSSAYAAALPHSILAVFAAKNCLPTTAQQPSYRVQPAVQPSPAGRRRANKPLFKCPTEREGLRAEAFHRRLLERFGASAEGIPLVVLDPTNWTAPFSPYPR